MTFQCFYSAAATNSKLDHYPSVQNFLIDFRKSEPVSNFRLNRFPRAAKVTNLSLTGSKSRFFFYCKLQSVENTLTNDEDLLRIPQN